MWRNFFHLSPLPGVCTYSQQVHKQVQVMQEIKKWLLSSKINSGKGTRQRFMGYGDKTKLILCLHAILFKFVISAIQ